MRYAISLQMVISFACLSLVFLLWYRGPVVHQENLADVPEDQNFLDASTNVVPSLVDDSMSDEETKILVKAEKLIIENELPKRYSVKSGDTLGHIAQRFGLSVAQLKAMNKLQSDVITVGKELRISETQ